MNFKIIFSAILIFTVNSLYGQGTAAVPFLLLQQSPLFTGAGNTGVSVPTEDVIGYYYNPANLGNFSKTSNLGLYLMPEKNDWLYYDVNDRTTGLSIGYNFAGTSLNIPVSIGFGYIHNRINYGSFFSGDRASDSYDEFDGYSFGIGIDYYLRFNFGISYKSFYSQLGIPTGSLPLTGKASGSALDFGAMFTLPVSELFFNDYRYKFKNDSYLIPFLNFTLGYSLSNYGDKINYGDPSQSDPIPRTARLGYTFDFGLDLRLKNDLITTLKFSLITEASDMLLERTPDNIEYQGLLGDISITDNLISQKGTDLVTLHRGTIMEFMETVIFTYGKINGGGFENKETRGVIVRTDGLLKLLLSSVENSNVKFLSEHFSLQYYNVENLLKVKIEGISLSVKNMSFETLGF